MNHHIIDPLSDPRWGRLVERHPKASVFHTAGWLESLRRTYGYRIFALTASLPGHELETGIPFCHINSWFTGQRLVSLPFSDHCDPLIDQPGRVSSLLRSLQARPELGNRKYVELRPLDAACGVETTATGFTCCARFYFHRLDLRSGPGAIYKRFHKDCVQRKIRRAEREKLTVEQGQSERLLRDFYRLHLRTRRRQGLVPQPFAWFQNLAGCLGPAMQVRAAYLKNQPVAAIVTLRHRDRIVYKYGSSDARSNALGGTQLLFWSAIQEACEQGLHEFDLGRTGCDNPGLIIFKERLGATRNDLAYVRCPAPITSGAGKPYFHVLNRVLSWAPLNLLRAAGALLYRHAG
ncbi:MAG: GNAT family N-acetyltransferase [Acidobacteriia bacterium]|nr:GNAT family N-acetyltransferase [Terriglobia bacterium]